MFCSNWRKSWYRTAFDCFARPDVIDNRAEQEHKKQRLKNVNQGHCEEEEEEEKQISMFAYLH